MVKSVDLARETPEDELMDMVNAYKLHSEEGIEALRAIVEGPLKKRNRRDVVVRLLDLLHDLGTDYGAIAIVLVQEGDFPDRAERWPALFPPRGASSGGER